MEGVTGDPSLNSVSHEFKIENGLSVLRVLKELHRRALRTITWPRTLDGFVCGENLSGLQGLSQGALQVHI